MFLWNKHLQSSLFSKLIRNSAGAMHTLIGPLFIIKEQLQPYILSNLLCFCRIGIVATRYHNFDTSLISGMHILKEVCYILTSFPAIHFFYDRVIISWEHLKWCMSRTLCFFSQHWLQPSIITSDLWLIREKLKGMFMRKTILAFWICKHYICWNFF